MKRMNEFNVVKNLGSFLALSLFACFNSLSAQNDIKAEFTGMKSCDGKIMIATRAGQYAMASINADTTCVVTLANVPDGECIIMAFHDENGNYQLDMTNGVPAEYCSIDTVAVDGKSVEPVQIRLKEVKTSIIANN